MSLSLFVKKDTLFKKKVRMFNVLNNTYLNLLKFVTWHHIFTKNEKKLKKHIDKNIKIIYSKFRIILKKESYDKTKKTSVRRLKRGL